MFMKEENFLEVYIQKVKRILEVPQNWQFFLKMDIHRTLKPQPTSMAEHSKMNP
jgi:hypothetical protein